MKTAFVLSGGGAKGSFQFGVIQQLYNKGIRPDVLYGTSVGALNACGYSHVGVEALRKFWMDIKGHDDILSPGGFSWLWNFPRLFYKTGIYNTEPLQKKVKDIVLNNQPTVEAVSCFVSLKTGAKTYWSCNKVSKPDYAKSVIYSATIPLIMEPLDWMVDGGVREQTPLSQAIDDGADKIYVILCNPWQELPEPWKPHYKLIKWFDVLNRSVDDIMSHEIFRNDIENALFYNKNLDRFPGKKKVEIHLYAPDRYWMNTIEFDPAKIRAAIAAGEQAQELPLPEV